MVAKLPKILVVDDEAAVLRAIARELRASFDVRTCPSGGSAINRLADERFDAVVSDFHLQDALGTDVLRAARSFNPSARRVLVSASPAEVPATEAGLIELLLEKPWRANELISSLERLLGG